MKNININGCHDVSLYLHIDFTIQHSICYGGDFESAITIMAQFTSIKVKKY